MKMKLTRNNLRCLIREVINTWHKNYYTAYDNPYSYEDYPEVDIQKYANHDGTWGVKINCEFDDSLSEPLRVFKTEQDASDYSRKKADTIHRAYINRDEL